jgi:hypothetical protein
MEGLKIKKSKECHFTPEIFSPKDGKKRKSKSIVLLCGNKSAQFLSPLKF